MKNQSNPEFLIHLTKISYYIEIQTMCDNMIFLQIYALEHTPASKKTINKINNIMKQSKYLFHEKCSYKPKKFCLKQCVYVKVYFDENSSCQYSVHFFSVVVFETWNSTEPYIAIRAEKCTVLPFSFFRTNNTFTTFLFLPLFILIIAINHEVMTN